MIDFDAFSIHIEKERRYDFQDRDKWGYIIKKSLPPTKYIYKLICDIREDEDMILTRGEIPIDHPNPKEEARKQIVEYLTALTEWAKEKEIY